MTETGETVCPSDEEPPATTAEERGEFLPGDPEVGEPPIKEFPVVPVTLGLGAAAVLFVLLT